MARRRRIEWPLKTGTQAILVPIATPRAALRPAASTAFTPASLPGLTMWFKADGTLWQDSARTTPATADGNPVGAWDDASGNGNHLLQATAGQRPLYKTGIVNTKPVLRFDGVDDALRLASVTLGPFTLFLVTQVSTVGILYEHSDNTNGGTGSFMYGTTGSTIRVDRSGSNSAKDLAASWAVGASFRNLMHIFDGTHAGDQLYIGGVNQTLTDGAATDPGTATTAQPFNLMSRAAASLFTQADVAEVIVYSRALIGSEISSVNSYLTGKYAV